MEDETIERLVTDLGLSPTEAVDLYFTMYGDYTQASWARQRGVSQQTVSRNVSNGLDLLDDDM